MARFEEIFVPAIAPDTSKSSKDVATDFFNLLPVIRKMFTLLSLILNNGISFSDNFRGRL